MNVKEYLTAIRALHDKLTDTSIPSDISDKQDDELSYYAVKAENALLKLLYVVMETQDDSTEEK